MTESATSHPSVLDYRLLQAEKALDHFSKTIKETESGFRESMEKTRGEFSSGLKETNDRLAEMTKAFERAQVCERRVESIEKRVESHEDLVRILKRLTDFLTSKRTKRLVFTLVVAYVGTRPDWAWITHWLQTVGN